MQARRRTLLVLEDEIRRVMDATREIAMEFQALFKGDKTILLASLEKIRKAETDVVTLRRALTRELAQIGTLLVNREDLLRTAFAIESIVGHINGIGFKMSQLRRSFLKNKRYREQISSLIDLLIQEISKLNECVRALSINPEQAIEMASQIQKIESEIDTKYREAIVMVMKSVKGYRDLITTKDVIQSIEDCADATLLAADATTIVALGV
jgi:uncharacterized protein Yka (UPF0111/DUF47 family)